MKLFAISLAAALLASSAASAGLPNPLTPFTPPAKAQSNPISDLKTITLNDLNAALADANAQPVNAPLCSSKPPSGVVCQQDPYVATTAGVSVSASGDVRHANCWAALIDFKTTFMATNPLPGQLGLALLQQKIFDAKAIAGKPLLPDYVTHNCVDTFNDANMELARITGMLGISIPKIP